MAVGAVRCWERACWESVAGRSLFLLSLVASLGAIHKGCLQEGLVPPLSGALYINANYGQGDGSKKLQMLRTADVLHDGYHFARRRTCSDLFGDSLTLADQSETSSLRT